MSELPIENPGEYGDSSSTKGTSQPIPDGGQGHHRPVEGDRVDHAGALVLLLRTYLFYCGVRACAIVLVLSVVRD